MSCPNSNITLPEFPNIDWGCQGDHGGIPTGRHYLYPPAGEREFPVLSVHELDEDTLALAATGKPYEVTLALTEGMVPDDIQKLRDGLPGGVVDAGDGVIKLKAHIVL